MTRRQRDRGQTGSTVARLPDAAPSRVMVLSGSRTETPRPQPGFEYITLEANRAGVLLIKLSSSDRPPTMDGDQLRHISSYTLMVQMLYATIEGMEIMPAIRAIENMLASYVSTKSVLKRHREVVEKELQTSPTLLEYTKRADIERALNEALDFYSDEGVTDTMDALSGSRSRNDRRTADYYRHGKKAFLAIREIDPSIIRNTLKSSELLGPTRKVLFAAIMSAMKVLNKMHGVSFKGKHTKAPKNEGSEAEKAIRFLKSVSKLPSNKIYPPETIQAIYSKIAFLFDYPMQEFITDPNTNNDTQIQTCKRMIRKHIKLIYDAFPNLQPALSRPDARAEILIPFMRFVCDNMGWRAVNDTESTFKRSNTLYEAVMEGLDFKDRRCDFAANERIEAAQPKYLNPSRLHRLHSKEAQQAYRARRLSNQQPGGGAAASSYEEDSDSSFSSSS